MVETTGRSRPRALPRASSSACSWVLAASLYGALLGACSQDAGARAAQSCAPDCPHEAPRTDFSDDKPRFEAHVRVVDSSGKPVEKARVEIGERTGSTGADGRATLKNLDARSASALKVSSDKAAPYYARTDAWKSGQTTHNVTLSPFALKTKVDLDAPLVVQKDFGRLSLPKDAIADAEGRRAESANLEVADLIGNDKNSQARLREFKAVDKRGMPSVVKKVEALGHVRFTTDSGDELGLAPTKNALLELALPEGSDARPGDKRSLWSLDQKSLTLHEEGECVVEEHAQPDRKSTRVCKGSVSHFSVWAVGSAPGADDPLALGCLDVRPAPLADACFTIEVERVFLLACDESGEGCAETAYRDVLFAPGEGQAAAYCGVLEWSPRYRVAVLYASDVSGCSGEHAELAGGRRIKLSEPLSATSHDAGLLAAFAAGASGTCAEACTSLELHIGPDDFSAPLLTDADNDGHYAAAGARATLFPGRRADCDDDDAQTHPGAPELFCGDVDRNCDGMAPPAAHNASALADDVTWNAICALCGDAVALGDEQPGNLLDEDCDGYAEDRDGDGHAEPDDCDDFSAAVAPGESELPGNPVDEDCDGVSLDWDGDGLPAPTHAYLSEATGIALARFTDCDDYDAAIHPGAPDAAQGCASEPGAAGCPAFRWSGAFVQTHCEEIVDAGEPTGVGACVFGGWSEGNLLSLEAGQLWGPCDGRGPLPDCPSNAQCAGPLPYADEYIGYLERTYSGGAPLSYQGMCFPLCEL
jgi:Putative metal-binding motif